MELAIIIGWHVKTHGCIIIVMYVCYERNPDDEK
jgi:hypothetical protein